MLAAEQLLPVVKYDGMTFCMGPRSAAERVYEYAEDFVRLHSDHGYFAVFWLNTFSHNDVNAPSTMDRRTADMLSRLLDGRLLNNAVAVVLSDHGLRFGKIRATHVGWLEDRMPAFYFRLPPGYAAARPNYRATMAANKNRLTSPFDLHLTLKQLMSDDRAVADGCPTCRSLFQLADANRLGPRACYINIYTVRQEWAT
jgi:membrane-anchored protein YejM (alkaline phosphatase superfamily)